jgi:hypothetical protein
MNDELKNKIIHTFLNLNFELVVAKNTIHIFQYQNYYKILHPNDILTTQYDFILDQTKYILWFDDEGNCAFTLTFNFELAVHKQDAIHLLLEKENYGLRGAKLRFVAQEENCSLEVVKVFSLTEIADLINYDLKAFVSSFSLTGMYKIYRIAYNLLAPKDKHFPITKQMGLIKTRETDHACDYYQAFINEYLVKNNIEITEFDFWTTSFLYPKASNTNYTICKIFPDYGICSIVLFLNDTAEIVDYKVISYLNSLLHYGKIEIYS